MTYHLLSHPCEGGPPGGTCGDQKHLERLVRHHAIEGPPGGAKARPQRRADPLRRLDQVDCAGRGCLVKTIENTIGPKGEAKVETKGFKGREASRFVEQVLGRRSAEIPNL